MTTFGITPQGFKRKRYEDIIADMEARARVLYGDDVNLTERSPLGLFLKSVAWEQAKSWELAEEVYYSGYKDDAEGVSLDGVSKFIGMTRKPAEKARFANDEMTPAWIAVTGTSGTVVPAGFLVRTKEGTAFEVVETVTIQPSGAADAVIQAVLPGIGGNVPANTIAEIVNPVTGVTSVNNPSAVKGGKAEELDYELRDRYDSSLSLGGASTVDSVRAALLQLEGVKTALVIENDTMLEDADGRPPKSISAYVDGGDPSLVTKLILQTKAGGIRAAGSMELDVQDDAGTMHTIGYTPAEPVYVWVLVTLTTNAYFPVNGDNLVRTEIIKYIGGTDAGMVEYSGIGMGRTVVHAKCIEAAFNIQGVADVSVELSTDGAVFSPANVPISYSQVAKTDHVRVAVVYA
jgi:uncharacterized phage protein gp47/JayE